MRRTFRVIISPEASDDLTTLHAYIAQDSPQNAVRMVERILAAIETLKTLPHRTLFERPSRKIKHPVRTLPVRPYVVYFRVLDDERLVRILTVRHGARRRPGKPPR